FIMSASMDESALITATSRARYSFLLASSSAALKLFKLFFIPDPSVVDKGISTRIQIRVFFVAHAWCCFAR
ncbi:hypothetical protein, partial [Escherichia coli]|uniref:hypothetical protein n=1 Tax=Escherichia coli TaxID=562 RepID=UPI001BCA554A